MVGSESSPFAVVNDDAGERRYVNIDEYRTQPDISKAIQLALRRNQRKEEGAFGPVTGRKDVQMLSLVGGLLDIEDRDG